MKLKTIAEVVQGQIVYNPTFDLEIEEAFASDLMSDVLALANPDMLLITGLINMQAVRTAEMADLPAILFVRGKHPTEEMLALARDACIAILISPYTMYETCGLLYQAGLQGKGKVALVERK